MIYLSCSLCAEYAAFKALKFPKQCSGGNLLQTSWTSGCTMLPLWEIVKHATTFFKSNLVSSPPTYPKTILGKLPNPFALWQIGIFMGLDFCPPSQLCCGRGILDYPLSVSPSVRPASITFATIEYPLSIQSLHLLARQLATGYT